MRESELTIGFPAEMDSSPKPLLTTTDCTNNTHSNTSLDHLAPGQQGPDGIEECLRGCDGINLPHCCKSDIYRTSILIATREVIHDCYNDLVFAFRGKASKLLVHGSPLLSAEVQWRGHILNYSASAITGEFY